MFIFLLQFQHLILSEPVDENFGKLVVSPTASEFHTQLEQLERFEQTNPQETLDFNSDEELEPLDLDLGVEF